MNGNIWKKAAAILTALTLALTFAACGAKSADGAKATEESYSTVKAFTTNGMLADNNDAPGETPTEAAKSQNSKLTYSGNRKIIRNASLELSTEKYSETIRAIEKATAELDGYIEESHETKYDEYTYTTMTLRIPTEKLDEFLSKMDGVATVESKSISSDDITSSYVDTESHLTALKTEQETLLSLLSQANGLSEILEIQDRLTSVRAEIEYYQSMMNTFENELEYSTVNLQIDEVKHEIQTGTGFWSKMGTGLKESFYNVGRGFLNFISWIVINIPYFIIIGIIVAVLCVIIKKLRAKRKAKKASKPKDENNAGQADSSDVSGQK